jgi:hypothetical protein
MPILNSIISWVMKQRIHQTELFMKYPNEVQDEWFNKLVDSAKNTEWGRKYDYASLKGVAAFNERVPVQSYDSLKPYIERLRKGEQNLLWASDVKWFAKSSGTTNDKSKFIPVSQEALEECHFKGGKDLLSFYCNNFPDTQIFDGKGLSLGGSHQIDPYSNESVYGDVSAIIIQNLPLWAEFIRTPDVSIALMENWEEKIEKICEATLQENVSSISGVPTWTLVLAQRLLEITGKNNLLEIWPNLEAYFHGAVSMEPYREQFRKLMPKGRVNFTETYSASEGFFGIQDVPDTGDMLLMLDYGIYYQFLPMSEVGKEFPATLELYQVKLHTDYALVISTNAGLWRYMIGDTIKFVSLNPYRIRISGRTKHFINAFGEELIIDNAEKALTIACNKNKSVIREYTAAPIYFEGNKKAAHEWLIEFVTPPENLEQFTADLDAALQTLNSDYEAKRAKNMALTKPVVKSMKAGTFYNWLKLKGKLGGQHKVPRLANDRKYIDEILAQISA